MLSFLVRRLAQTLIVLASLSFFCYCLLTLMPGDPVELLIASNPRITSEDVQRLRELYGLDQPILKRYGTWVSTLAQGDLGYSRTYRIPVSEILGPKLFNTFLLSFVSLLLSLVIALPIGVLCALKPNSKLDYSIGFLSFGGISAPSFWVGLMLILIFAVKLGVLPASGTSSSGIEEQGFWIQVFDRCKYLALPCLTLTYLNVGRFIRFTRAAMLESLKNDFVRTAKAKGLSEQQVIWKHAFRNAMLPLITVITLSFSGVFSGATITETVFAYQGVGKLVYDSVLANDFNVAMVSFMISVAMVLIFNLLADILYSFADPRIRLA